jgi:hypothetical protein
MLQVLHLGLNGTLGLSNVDPSTFIGYTVNAKCFQAKVILDMLNVACKLPLQEAYNSDMSHQHPGDAVEGWSKKG